jgi:hypothetical protein
MFELLENPNPIVIEDVHVFNFKNLKKNLYTNMDHKFQNVWALKMPWVEPIFSEAKMVTSMKCCVYSKIGKKDKVLVQSGIKLRIMHGKGKPLMVSGLWIQNVGMQK